MSTRSLKERGQDAAAAYLERIGMTVIERSWRCDAGVIDVVALDQETLVLVGVKTTKSGRQEGSQAVSAATGRRIKKIADAYIQANDLGGIEWRYDRITLLLVAEDRALLRHQRYALAPAE
jgi:putative endonuclease